MRYDPCAHPPCTRYDACLCFWGDDWPYFGWMTAHHISTIVSDKFPTLGFVPVRTVQKTLQAWKVSHRAEIMALTNPDRFKSSYRTAGRGSHPVSRLNQLWMIDASPADMLCVDGLPANFVNTDVSEAHLIEAINAAKTPALASFVPRADLELALASRATAEQALATYLKTQRDASVAALLDGAVKDGKVAPASRPHYEALCSTDAGFAEVQKLVAAQPSFFKQAADAGNVNDQHMALTAEERRVVAAMGISEKDFLETKALQTA